MAFSVAFVIADQWMVFLFFGQHLLILKHSYDSEKFFNIYMAFFGELIILLELGCVYNFKHLMKPSNL